MGGCTSNVHRPEIAEATKNKDGVFFVDLRRTVASAGEAEREKSIAKELVEKNCKLPENVNNAVCENPQGFVLYSAQVRNAIWNSIPKMYSLNSEASILPRRMSAALNKWRSSWGRVSGMV